MMSRLAGILLAGLLVAGVGKANAQEPHQEWMKFLEGEWTAKVEVGGKQLPEVGAEATYTLVAKQSAVVSRGKMGDGVWIELIGWRADTKTMVITRYGSNGDYFEAKCRVSKNEMSGEVVGAGATKGTVVVKRVSNDCFESHVELSTADGQKLSSVGVYTRKHAADPK